MNMNSGTVTGNLLAVLLVVSNGGVAEMSVASESAAEEYVAQRAVNENCAPSGTGCPLETTASLRAPDHVVYQTRADVVAPQPNQDSTTAKVETALNGTKPASKTTEGSE